MQMATGMKPEERKVVGAQLAQLLADVYTVYVQTQCCHWNLVGPEFYSIHIMLDKQYHDLVKPIDELAERIRELDLYVDASLVSFQAQSNLEEMRAPMPTPKALELLLKNLEAVVRRAREVGDVAEDHHDHATVDFIGRFMGQIEKSAWMIRSQLHK